MSYTETFASMGKTLAAPVGLPTETIDANIRPGKVIEGALSG